MKTLKKTTFVAAIMFSSLIYSQNEMLFGINGGATYSNTRGNVIADEGNASLDFLIGFAAEYSISESFSIKINLNYERKTTSIESITFENTNIRTTYSYLTLPILAKYSFGSSKDFYLNGGPFVGFLLNAKSKADDFPSATFTDLQNKVDVGLSVGIGKRFELSDSNSLDVEIRNNLGLVNISAVKVIDDATVKTNAINLILMYNFTL